MGFFKSMFNWFANLFSTDDMKALIRAVIVQVIREEYGLATPQNRSAVFDSALSRLEKKGIDVKRNRRLIAAVLNEELDAQVMTTQKGGGKR